MQPVKKQLKQFVLLCNTSEDYQQKLARLSNIVKSEEWKLVIEILWSIKNDMAIELLQSTKFIKEDISNKDITQRVYHNIAEWIDFLTNPMKWIAKKGRIQLISNNLKAGKAERKESKHG